jgi:hypothetical protein
VNVIGAVPVQVPGLAVRVAPCCGVPEIVGGEVLTKSEAALELAVSNQEANAAARRVTLTARK